MLKCLEAEVRTTMTFVDNEIMICYKYHLGYDLAVYKGKIQITPTNTLSEDWGE